MEGNYTQKYEYACAMIADFVDREALIDQSSNSENVYGENSIILWAFTTDFSMVRDTQVRKEIEDKLGKFNADKSRPYQMALTRLKSTYVDMCAALGIEFADEMQKNIVESLMRLANTVSRKDRKQIEAFFKSWPYLSLCIIGKKAFIKKLFLAKRAQKTSTQNKVL